MQIAKSHTLPILPALPDPSRTRTRTEAYGLTVLPERAQEGRPSRTVDEIRQAERMLERQRSRDAYHLQSEDTAANERAITAYQSLQQNDERNYVSEVLGIDVFA